MSAASDDDDDGLSRQYYNIHVDSHYSLFYIIMLDVAVCIE